MKQASRANFSLLSRQERRYRNDLILYSHFLFIFNLMQELFTLLLELETGDQASGEFSNCCWSGNVRIAYSNHHHVRRPWHGN